MSEPRRLRGSPTVLHVPSGRPCPPDMLRRATVCAFPYTGSSQATMMKPVQSRTLQRQGKSGTTQTSVCGPGRTSCGLVPVTDLQLSADPTSLRPARDKTAACSVGSIWVAARKLWASTGDGVICRIDLKRVYIREEASRPHVKEHFGHVSTSMSHAYAHHQSSFTDFARTRIAAYSTETRSFVWHHLTSRELVRVQGTTRWRSRDIRVLCRCYGPVV